MSSWAFGVIVVLVLIITLFSFFKLQSSRDWIATDGKVISSSIEELSASRVDGNAGQYKVNISYQYFIDGVTYDGNVVTAGLPSVFSSKTDAEDMLAKYPEDAGAKVYYNPDNRGEAALITGKQIPIAAFVIIFLMIIGIAGGIFFLLKSGILN